MYLLSEEVDADQEIRNNETNPSPDDAENIGDTAIESVEKIIGKLLEKQ